MKYWYGSKAQYNAISTKDPNTIYDVYEQVILWLQEKEFMSEGMKLSSDMLVQDWLGKV